MTTVRFLTRWFYNKSTQTKLRVEPSRELPVKSTGIHVNKPKPSEPKITWSNPIRWHI